MLPGKMATVSPKREEQAVTGEMRGSVGQLMAEEAASLHREAEDEEIARRQEGRETPAGATGRDEALAAGSVGVYVTVPGDGCFETGDAVGGFTGAVGRRRRLEPSDASSRTVQSNLLYFDGYEREEGAQKSAPVAAARGRKTLL
ncbi:hypothetical protein B296_00021862 [Ensete ventricosum]|uniref:Uncharacterized protein n=1 Tax=Ensete ventricosum TaxID=4639 RepID=A0A426XV60_ENSVE|nr:hypothetical protein B296_00021862 [Ensete ventricosum]